MRLRTAAVLVVGCIFAASLCEAKNQGQPSAGSKGKGVGIQTRQFRHEQNERKREMYKAQKEEKKAFKEQIKTENKDFLMKRKQEQTEAENKPE